MKTYYSNLKLDEVARAIVRLMPTQDQFFSCELPLEVYSRNINEYRANDTHIERQKAFKRLIRNKVERIFNASELRQIDLRVPDDEGMVTGVIDHHGIIDHPILFGGILASSLYRLFSKKKKGDLLTFATGNISHCEPFSRGGIMFQGKRVRLYPKKDKNRLIYASFPQKFSFVERLQKEHIWHKYSTQEKIFFESIDDLIRRIDFSQCRSLGDQITKINFYLWPRLFAQELRSSLSNLISLEYDDLVSHYLIHVLTNDKNSFVYRMLFDQDIRREILGLFEGVVGAWNEEEKKGTHLFWGIDEEGKRISYQIQNGTLTSDNGASIPLNEESIIRNLEERKLLCGMLLKFSLLIFYMGLKPHAGFSSVEYITRMKARFISFLESTFPEEAEIVKSLPINSMISNPVIYAKKENAVTPIYAFDLMYSSGISKEYLDKASQLPFKSFMAPFLQYYNFAVSRYGTEADKREFVLSQENLYDPLNILFS